MDVFERIAALRREGQSFVVATVVARRAPVSAHLGDRAIVFPDGRMEGFVGGACAHEIIRQQALDALQARHSRLVSIRPDASESSEPTAEHVVIPMSCASEGAVDVYVEPFVQARRLVVVGATPVADALTRLARGMDYDVVRVVDGRETRDIGQEAASLGVTVVTLDSLEAILGEGGASNARRQDQAAVVASQGHYDDQALESILKCNISYVGLVASRQRGAAISAWLDERRVPGVASVRIPAGLDLGARTAPEVALSILAEIVRAHPSQALPQTTSTTSTTSPPTAPLPATASVADVPAAPILAASGAVDPVCGMRVDVTTARHRADVDGVLYYFCCANCRSRFLEDPRQYAARTP